MTVNIIIGYSPPIHPAILAGSLSSSFSNEQSCLFPRGCSHWETLLRRFLLREALNKWAQIQYNTIALENYASILFSVKFSVISTYTCVGGNVCARVKGTVTTDPIRWTKDPVEGLGCQRGRYTPPYLFFL